MFSKSNQFDIPIPSTIYTYYLCCVQTVGVELYVREYTAKGCRADKNKKQFNKATHIPLAELCVSTSGCCCHHGVTFAALQSYDDI